MTDMRATERLLEVIEIHVRVLETCPPEHNRDSIDAISVAITELRRRGDTLVRAADLRAVLEYADADPPTGLVYPAEASDRLENALGGRMR